MRKKGEPFNRLAWLEDEEPKKRSQRQERRIARETGGSPQRASGATQGRKGDIVDVPMCDIPVGDLKIEAKTTKDLSYRLTYHELEKIETEALLTGKRGAMMISFEDRHDYLVIRKDYVKFEVPKCRKKMR